MKESGNVLYKLFLLFGKEPNKTFGHFPEAREEEEEEEELRKSSSCLVLSRLLQAAKKTSAKTCGRK